MAQTQTRRRTRTYTRLRKEPGCVLASGFLTSLESEQPPSAFTCASCRLEAVMRERNQQRDVLQASPLARPRVALPTQ